MPFFAAYCFLGFLNVAVDIHGWKGFIVQFQQIGISFHSLQILLTLLELGFVFAEIQKILLFCSIPSQRLDNLGEFFLCPFFVFHKFADVLFELRQLFVGDDVFLECRHVGSDGVVCFGRPLFLLLDFGGDGGVEFLAADEFLEQLVAFVFLGGEEISERALGNEHCAQELLVLETDNRGNVFPTGLFLFEQSVFAGEQVEASLRSVVFLGLESHMPFGAIHIAVVGLEG